MALRAYEPANPTGQRVDAHLGRRLIEKRKANPGDGDKQGAHRAQGRGRAWIEPLECLRKTAIPVRHDGPEEILRAVGIGFPDVLRGPVEIPEDASDLLLEEGEAIRSEAGDVVFHPRPQKIGCQLVPGLDVGTRFGELGRDSPSGFDLWVDRSNGPFTNRHG
jgi:hypothetical protein